MFAGYGGHFACFFQSRHETIAARVEIAEGAMEYITRGERIDSPNLWHVNLSGGLSVKVKYGPLAPRDGDLVYADLSQSLENL